MRRPVWKLDYVITRLLVVVCVVDMGMRFMPIDPFTFRAWEAVFRNRPSGDAFEANKRYYNPQSFGDLASYGNFPDLRQYRPERFTTDSLGFRNVPDVLNEEVSAILTGDSFAVGSGVSDDETLSSRLRLLTGCVVYNAGSDQGRVMPENILAAVQRLHLRSRLIIRLYSEGADLPARPTRRAVVVQHLVTSVPREVRDVLGRLRGLVVVDPLQVLIGHAWKAIANNRVLPNRYATNVVRATLTNGETMLFEAARVANFYRRHEVSLDYWTWFREEMQKAHFDVLVVLVPEKYHVYRPFLIDQKPFDPGEGDYLGRLEQKLERAGIPVLNLTPLLLTEAARHVERGEYLYFLDDIHWNAHGIALAAEAIRQGWPLTEAACSAPRSPVAQKP